MTHWLSGLRIPLGIQFFAAAIVMGGIAIVMALSTLSMSNSVELSLAALSPAIEAAGSADALDTLVASQDALAAGKGRGLLLALVVAGIGVGAAGFLTLTVGRVAKRLAGTASAIAGNDLPAFASAIPVLRSIT